MCTSCLSISNNADVCETPVKSVVKINISLVVIMTENPTYLCLVCINWKGCILHFTCFRYFWNSGLYLSSKTIGNFHQKTCRWRSLVILCKGPLGSQHRHSENIHLPFSDSNKRSASLWVASSCDCCFAGFVQCFLRTVGLIHAWSSH